MVDKDRVRRLPLIKLFEQAVKEKDWELIEESGQALIDAFSLYIRMKCTLSVAYRQARRHNHVLRDGLCKSLHDLRTTRRLLEAIKE
ncbi:MAG: hypothetical protein MN733_42250 [Nitrososphaera sp.]|nr:hypothetical protein [Nitrososphaera sp.]